MEELGEGICTTPREAREDARDQYRDVHDVGTEVEGSGRRVACELDRVVQRRSLRAHHQVEKRHRIQNQLRMIRPH